MKKIALFGGSFNPPHIGHKAVAELIRDSFECDEIWLLPSGERRDKTMSASTHHRKEMSQILCTQIQTQEKPTAYVCEHELMKTEKTSTFQTLTELQNMYSEHEFHLVVSSELVPEIESKWVEGKKLFAQAHFVVFQRPGYKNLDTVSLPIKSVLLESQKPLPEMSSTQIRTLTDKKILEQFTGKEIADYIQENSLYGFEDI